MNSVDQASLCWSLTQLEFIQIYLYQEWGCLIGSFRKKKIAPLFLFLSLLSRRFKKKKNLSIFQIRNNGCFSWKHDFLPLWNNRTFQCFYFFPCFTRALKKQNALNHLFRLYLLVSMQRKDTNFKTCVYGSKEHTQ